MKILSIDLQNFASYAKLNFQFDETGLALIQGPTGSGKSTLCDAVPWILFGRTAKDGAVDEVLSWGSDEPTRGEAVIEPGGADPTIRIVRTRGSSNDLYFFKNEDGPIRGRDMLDTQKHINYYLRGTTAELYLAGAYFHEFSQTAQFFTTTAKNRRTICEQLVDLSLPKKLQTRLAEETKTQSKALSKITTTLLYSTQALAHTEKIAKSERLKFVSWKDDQQERKAALEKLAKNFEKDKNKAITSYTTAKLEYDLQALKSKNCSACGAVLADKKHAYHNPYNDKIEEARNRVNTYDERLQALDREANPYGAALLDYGDAIKALNSDIADQTSTKDQLTSDLNDLEVLGDVIAAFRMHLIDTTIQGVQYEVNSLLSNHFDAEINVKFESQEADKIEVTIAKDGNRCAYTQLSKGQRQILKLCFGVAVMKTIAKHHSVSFSQVFFDEALDGLDDNMKQKALGLLRGLQTTYDQIFVVEHNELLKALIETQYRVELVNGASKIEKAS